jgi:hypothetical protein
MAPQPPRDLRPAQRAAHHDRQRVVPDILARLKRVGVDLDRYAWTFERAFADGTGFYFSCGAYRELINAAEESRKMEVNFEDLPAHNKWLNVTQIGFIETGAAEPVAIDFSLTRYGDCRAYYLPHFSKQRGEAFRQHVLKAAHENAVYNEIARRLTACNPPVVLDDHIGRIQRFGQTTLDGINFFARDYKKLKQTLVEAKNGIGEPFFGHAILDNLDHWALRISFLATDGTGFREASWLKLRETPLMGAGPLDRREGRGWRRNAGRFTGAFPEADVLPDMSSLHCAVSNQGCNIHVDDVGFVLYDDAGNLVLDPDVVQHLFNELIFKTYGKYLLPEAVVNRVNLVLPSTANDFNRVGLSVDVYKTKKYRVTVSATCSVFGQHECSGTVSVSGRF